MQALHDVVQAGYVRYVGMSSCHAYQCEYYCVSSLIQNRAEGQYAPPRSSRHAEYVPLCPAIPLAR